MIKTRLLGVMGRQQTLEVIQEIVWKFLSLLAHLVLAGSIAMLITDCYYQRLSVQHGLIYALIAVLSVSSRLIFVKLFFDSKETVAEDVSNCVRNEVIEKILRIGNPYIYHSTTTHVGELLTEDCELIEAYYSEFLPNVGYAILGTGTMTMLLFAIDFAVATVFLVAIVIAIILFALVRKYEIFSCIRYIKAILEAFSYGVAAFALIGDIKDLGQSHIGLEWSLILFYLCIEVFKPLIAISDMLQDGIISGKAVDEFFSFFDIREPKEGKDGIPNEPVRLVFDKVAFKYESENVIENATMIIKGSTAIGIYGPEGAGKSTIAGILQKRNRNYSGSIKINGTELSRISQNTLFKTLTYVNADSYVLKKTIEENLQIGNPQAPEKRIVNALMVVGLWPQVKEKGGIKMTPEQCGFTEGQMRRLVFARALLKNTKLYVFDDITKGIDDQSKQDLLKLIHQLSKDMGRTILLFSDDISCLKGMDGIYEIAGGVVGEYGKTKVHN